MTRCVARNKLQRTTHARIVLFQLLVQLCQHVSDPLYECSRFRILGIEGHQSTRNDGREGLAKVKKRTGTSASSLAVCWFSSIRACSSSRSFNTDDLAESTERTSTSSLSCSVVMRVSSSKGSESNYQ